MVDDRNSSRSYVIFFNLSFNDKMICCLLSIKSYSVKTLIMFNHHKYRKSLEKPIEITTEYQHALST